MANFSTLGDDFLPFFRKLPTLKMAKEELQKATLLEKLRRLPYLYQRRENTLFRGEGKAMRGGMLGHQCP